MSNNDINSDSQYQGSTFHGPSLPNMVPFGCCDINSSQGQYGGLTRKELEEKLVGPLQVGWTVSRKCNFHCPHCFNNSGPHINDFLPSMESIIDNIIDASPFNVCLCGGEPFAWDNLLCDICSKLRNGGIPGVSLVTNAYMATADNIQRAIDSGLTRIQISVDGASELEHSVYRRSKGSFGKAQESIKDAIKIAGKEAVCVSMTPSRYNIDNFPDYVTLMIDLGIDNIRVQPLMPIGRGADSYQDYVPNADQYLSLQIMIIELRHKYMMEGRHLSIEWGDPLEHIWYYTETEAMPNFAFIHSNGWYQASPYIPILFCDLSKKSLKEVFVKARKDMWLIPIMKKMAKELVILDGMSRLRPKIYFEEPILIDCLDTEHWDIAKKCDDVDALIGYAHKRGLYPQMEL